MNSKPVIVALDYLDAKSALEMAARLDPAVCRVKVGKELHTAAGPQVVDALIKRQFDVFLDLKFHDIPNTVAGACRIAASQGVWMLNVHASGGSRMMLAAREAVDAASAAPLLIGVTVLTSLSDAEMTEIGFNGSAADNVLRLAALSKSCGLDGIVCSAQEARNLKTAFGSAFLLVTPGIRLDGDAAGDQRRVLTPLDAINMGADYLVIGRSISQSKDPVATLNAINRQIAAQRQVVTPA